jgi:hypothetical protein
VKISKKDYRERAARVAAGTESDDDRRLVELYADEMAGDAGETLTEIPEPVDESAPEIASMPASSKVRRTR